MYGGLLTDQHPNNVSNPCNNVQLRHQVNTAEDIGGRKQRIHRQFQFEQGISFRLQTDDE